MQEIKEEKEVELSPTQLKVLEAEFTKKIVGKRKSIEEIVKKLGINPATYYRNLKKINISDWRERQKARLKELGDLVIANIIYNLQKGNYDAGKDWMNKFAHLYTDQIDVVGRMQSMSDDELVDGMKNAIMTALQNKAKKSKALPEPKKPGSGAENSSEGHSGEDISNMVTVKEDQPDFDGRGIA